MSNNGPMGGPGGPSGNDPSNSSSTSTSGSGAGAGAGAGALGLAGAGALAGSGSGSDAYSGSNSDNWNGNGNGNLNGNLDANGNLNGNINDNMNTTSVTVTDKVTVDVSADVCAPTPPSYSNDTGSFNTTNTTYNVPINLTDSPINLAPANNFLAGSGDNFNFTGNGTDTAFHVDQVNSLIASNTLSDVSLTNDGGPFTQYANDLSGGSATAGGIDHTVGDTVSSAVSAAASATATLSAFTQNIVLGANIQYNSLSQSVVGNDVTHTTSMATTVDPGSHDMGHHS